MCFLEGPSFPPRCDWAPTMPCASLASISFIRTFLNTQHPAHFSALPCSTSRLAEPGAQDVVGG